MLIKYPRTYHAPFSLGSTSDDKVIPNLSHFDGVEVVVTEKMDGENTSLYRDHFHARSLDGRHHSSRDWVAAFWGSIRNDIPENFRVCGENLFARHSIQYDDLETYFYGFSVWNGTTCLSWDETLIYFELLNVKPVRVLYRGLFNESVIKALYNPDSVEIEGLVIRKTSDFEYDDFKYSVAKAVRKNHVQTENHWMHSEIVRNELKR